MSAIIPAVDGAATVPSLRTLGTGAQQAAGGTDSRLSNARTPTAHAATHVPGGTDDVLALNGWLSSTRIENIPRFAISSLTIQPTAGTIYVSLVRVPFDLLAIKLVVGLTTAGSGVTKFRLGLWTYTGTTLTLVAATADQSTAVNNGGNVGAFAPALAVAADMSTPLTQYQLTRGNWYGFSQLTVGGTSPKFQGLNNGLSGTLNLDPFMLYANNNGGTTWTDYAANQTLTSVTSGSSATYVYMGAASV